jgi:hypothetical protein
VYLVNQLKIHLNTHLKNTISIKYSVDRHTKNTYTSDYMLVVTKAYLGIKHRQIIGE